MTTDTNPVVLTGPASINGLGFAQFEADSRAQGFNAVLERLWAPLAEVPTHSHPFAVQAIVVQGEMWLTQDGVTRHLRAGDRFAVPQDHPHAERYGADGAIFWVARRSA